MSNCILPAYYIANSIPIKELCIEKNGNGKSYKGLDLKYLCFSGCCFDNANLKGANLSGSDFKGAYLRKTNLSQVQALNVDFTDAEMVAANLSEANLIRSNLSYANLERANLVGVQALRTIFSEAILTDVCIDGWGINSYTKFSGVHCERIFLEDGFHEPKPDSGKFQPGDLEKLILRLNKTLDLLFREGIDPQAFDLAFEQLKEQHKDARIESVETFEDGLKVVRIDFQDSQVDRSSEYQKFFVSYEKQLVAANERLGRRIL